MFYINVAIENIEGYVHVSSFLWLSSPHRFPSQMSGYETNGFSFVYSNWYAYLESGFIQSNMGSYYTKVKYGELAFA